MNFFNKMLHKYGILIILIVMIIFFSITSDNFLTTVNIVNIVRQIAMLGIAAVGMTFIILTGGIDLSVGSIIGLTGVVTSICMATFKLHPVIAVIIGLSSSILIGLINGILITKGKIPPLITTLAVMTSVRGICYIITGGLPVYDFPDSFGVIGKGNFLGIPIPVIIMIIAFVFGWITLNRSCFGRYLYALGGNEEASRLAGINSNKILLLNYVVAALFAGIAGIVMLSRITSGQPSAGVGFEMDVITAVVLGGISINGGEGDFIGVIYGVAIIGVLGNGLVMLNVYDYYQQLIKGLVLIFAVWFDLYYKRSKN